MAGRQARQRQSVKRKLATFNSAIKTGKVVERNGTGANGLGASLLARFGMAATRSRSWVHMVIFAAALAIALFVVTDIEFPRLGVVRVGSFDHFLKAVYDQMP